MNRPSFACSEDAPPASIARLSRVTRAHHIADLSTVKSSAVLVVCSSFESSPHQSKVRRSSACHP